MQTNYITFLMIGFITIAGEFGFSQVAAISQPDKSHTADNNESPASQIVIANIGDTEFEPAGEITLLEALARTLVENPDLAAFDFEVRVHEARELQTRLIRNPELNVEIEKFGSHGPVKGFNSAENSTKLSQIIELGGKRKKRVNNATLNTRLAEWDYEIKRLAILTNVNNRFIDLLAAQERMVLNRQLEDLSEKLYTAVKARANTGKVSPMEEIRAGAALSLVRIESGRWKQNLISARQRLLYAIGDTSKTFVKAAGSLERIDSFPNAEHLVDLVLQNPGVGRWVDEMNQRQATLKVEESRRIPDLKISGGIQHLNETDIRAFVIDMSVPLTMFDRNQGRILEARYAIEKSKEQRKAAELQILEKFSELYENLTNAYHEATALKNEVLPAVEKAFDAAITGYEQGKFDYLDVIDAQRTLYNTRVQYLTALTFYHKTKAEVEGMVGRSIVPAQTSIEGDR